MNPKVRYGAFKEQILFKMTDGYYYGKTISFQVARNAKFSKNFAVFILFRILLIPVIIIIIVSYSKASLRRWPTRRSPMVAHCA